MKIFCLLLVYTSHLVCMEYARYVPADSISSIPEAEQLRAAIARTVECEVSAEIPQSLVEDVICCIPKFRLNLPIPLLLFKTEKIRHIDDSKICPILTSIGASTQKLIAAFCFLGIKNFLSLPYGLQRGAILHNLFTLAQVSAKDAECMIRNPQVYGSADQEARIESLMRLDDCFACAVEYAKHLPQIRGFELIRPMDHKARCAYHVGEVVVIEEPGERHSYSPYPLFGLTRLSYGTDH